MRSQEVRDDRVSEEQGKHDPKEDFVLSCHLGALLLRNLGQRPSDEAGPEAHGRVHGQQHEKDANDRVHHHLHDVKGATKGEEDVEEDQGQDVVHERRRDDGLTELLLQHARLAQEPQRDAHARRGQGRARGQALREEVLAVSHCQQGPSSQGQDSAKNGHCTSLEADLLCFLEVEVHPGLEDHQGHAGVTDKCEDVGRELAVVGHI
mmetsp:Transcript_24440/g.46175  ORF Transcript_24440/g.46175 Transcript_24440/m.46175 type:complete len:207 (-) Transcript_24440:407-1027(-)